MKSTWRSFTLTVFLATTLLNPAHSYIITVDALGEECFFENVEAHTEIDLTFETLEGGFLDIDVTIKSPDGTEIYKGESESSGRYRFSAPTSGIYTYCFSNKMSVMTPKVVMFNLDVHSRATRTKR